MPEYPLKTRTQTLVNCTCQYMSMVTGSTFKCAQCDPVGSLMRDLESKANDLAMKSREFDRAWLELKHIRGMMKIFDVWREYRELWVSGLHAAIETNGRSVNDVLDE